MTLKTGKNTPKKIEVDVFSKPSDGNLIRADTVIVREIPRSFDKGLTTQNLGKPSYEKIRAQHGEFVKVMSDLGLKVITLPADEKYPDIQFPRDTLLSYKGVLFNLHPGAEGRKREVERNISDLAKACISVKRFDYPKGAFVEGGDVLAFEHQDFVLIGISGNPNNVRTNKEGAKALAQILKSIDPKVIVVAVKQTGVLHLETGLTPLTKEIALRDPRCMIEWSNPYYPLGDGKRVRLPPWKIIDLPEEEGYGAHVLPLRGEVIIAKNYPTVKKLAKQHYKRVIEVDMSESQKMDGSLRCWTILHNQKPA